MPVVDVERIPPKVRPNQPGWWWFEGSVEGRRPEVSLPVWIQELAQDASVFVRRGPAAPDLTAGTWHFLGDLVGEWRFLGEEELPRWSP